MCREVNVSLLYDLKNPLSKEKKLELIRKAYYIGNHHNIKIGGHHRLILGNIISGLKCKAGKKTILISADQKIYACQRFVGRVEAEYFTEGSSFSDVNCNHCIDGNCYSDDNKWLGQEIYKMYLENYPEYLQVNDFDKILFGVI